jgi:predicted glycoside hydrolase/deacetylase ChbG (UPF0249 family)
MNDAVLDAASSGLVRNISVMVPGPSFAHAAERLRSRGDLCLGLHVTLNAEWERVRWRPLSPRAEVPSLVDSGSYFPSHPIFFHEQGSSVDEMMIEIRRHSIVRERRASISAISTSTWA